MDKIGLFWKAPFGYKVQQVNTTSCGLFLVVLLTPKLEEGNDMSEEMLAYHYQMMRIDTKGCIVERAKYVLDC